LLFSPLAGVETFRESLQKSFPKETHAIDRYIAAVHAGNRPSTLYYPEKAMPASVALGENLM
jgi:hypothetical protein